MRSQKVEVRRIAALFVFVALAAPSCARKEPPKRYPLTGQILVVHADSRQLTVKHEDIPGLMPGMTMTFPVATPALMEGRAPGELITGTLEVQDFLGKLVAITRTGMSEVNANEAAMAAGLLAVGEPMPDAALVDQANRRRSLGEWRGHATLVTFTYTRCPLPTFCPLMDQNFATLQRNVAEEAALAGRVRLISVSFDPDHDTPAVLAAHARRLKADPGVWTFLTGDRVTLDRLAGKLGVGVVRGPSTSDEIQHNLRTLLFGADGRLVKVYAGGDWTPSAVLTDLRATLGGTSGR